MSTVAVADDVALVVIEKDIKELKYYGDEAIEAVASWLSRYSLSLAGKARR